MFTTDVLLPVCLAVIMTVLGMTLTTADFRRVLEAPKGIGIGLVNLLVISPLLAFAIAELFDLDPLLAVGLVLLGASPGGAMANLLTHLARGQVALSVTMTAISSVAALVTVPFFLGAAIDHFDSGLDGDVEMLGIVVRVFAITIVPLSLGMTIRHRAPRWVEDHYGRARVVSLVIFVLVVIAAILAEGDRARENFTDVAGACLALNVAAMSFSYTVARVARLPSPAATAIAMELGIHNSTLTITVAASIDTAIAIPAAVYSVFMFITAGSFARFMATRNVAPVTEAVSPA